MPSTAGIIETSGLVAVIEDQGDSVPAGFEQLTVSRPGSRVDLCMLTLLEFDAVVKEIRFEVRARLPSPPLESGVGTHHRQLEQSSCGLLDQMHRHGVVKFRCVNHNRIVAVVWEPIEDPPLHRPTIEPVLDPIPQSGRSFHGGHSREHLDRVAAKRSEHRGQKATIAGCNIHQTAPVSDSNRDLAQQPRHGRAVPTRSGGRGQIIAGPAPRHSSRGVITVLRVVQGELHELPKTDRSSALTDLP